MTSAFKSFSNRQSELNRFLWTTELTYGIVKEKGVLDRLPQNNRAWDEFSEIVCEAWFPNMKGEMHYKGTISEMRYQLDRNMTHLLLSVAVLFVTEYETFVEDRFPNLIPELKRKAKNRPFTIPRPVQLVRELTALNHLTNPSNIDPAITLKADLLKKIRDLYAHKGLRSIPRRVDEPEIENWRNYVERKDASLYSREVTDCIVQNVVGSAMRRSQAARKRGKSLGVEFFLALYTFTNIRKFAAQLDVAFP